MTDTMISELLRDRLAEVQGRMAAAARRAGRNPAEVTLVAVTKSVRPRVAACLPALGITQLGEGRPQELWRKAEAIPDVQWHLVGHLQRNKIERTVPQLNLLHSVDSLRLLTALDAFVQKRATGPFAVLLEVNCSREEAKGGFAVEELPALAEHLATLQSVRVEGLMTMAAASENPETARATFAELRELREQFRTRTGLPLPHLSMGMSGDYEVGIEEGATLVRVGTTLFHGLESE
jgi:hypothetical protein